MMNLGRMLKSLASAVLMGGVSVAAAPIVLLGDSWVCGQIYALPEVLQTKGSGLTSRGDCIPGSTASMWARDPERIESFLATNPDAKVVMVQLGGNDLVSGLAGQHSAEEIRAQLHDDMKQVLGVVHRAAPTASLVVNTYVYFPFDKAPCNGFAENMKYRGQPFDMVAFNALHRSMAETFKSLDVPNLTVVETYHVFQQKSGFCDDNVGSPPQDFIDCIHPSQPKHSELLSYVYERAFQKFEPAEVKEKALRGEAPVYTPKLLPSVCPTA
jgi:lysophospholipase L1-like esterase